MRHTYFAVGLSILASSASAFEIETQRRYAAENSNQVLRILSTADVEIFEPIIQAFQQTLPELSIQYDVASSADVMTALYDEGIRYDLAISSAMDLQTKLANDGFAQSYTSEITAGLPPWANWRDEVFAFTQEPAVLVISEAAFTNLPLPTNREALIDLLRSHPDVFDGRIGTYDVRTSGLGYLFATQDSRNTESFWRLTELMGRLRAKLYCCSAAMIEAVRSGELALAYNALGSYAQPRSANTPGIKTVELEDVTSVMLRTAIIPRNAAEPEVAGQMIDFLLGLNSRPDLTEKTGLPPIATPADASENQRPIRLGPGLLVFLDRMRRDTFLRSWTNSIEQN
ncbi:MAG: ABC transporter substrate-binding protein [Litoreibacter sp.]